jgi:hypothetical protein
VGKTSEDEPTELDTSPEKKQALHITWIKEEGKIFQETDE